MKHILVIILILFCLDVTMAGNKTYTSNVTSGNWSSAASWTPSGVPAPTDRVRILPGHTIILDVDLLNGAQAGVKNVTVEAGGSLIGSSSCTSCGILFASSDSLYVRGIVNIPCIGLKNNSGSLVSSTGSLTLYGTCTFIDAGCSLTVTGFTLISGSISNNGTISGTGTLTVGPTGTVNGTGTVFGLPSTSVTPGQTISAYTWKSTATNSSWTNTANWSGAAVPTSTSNVSIMPGGVQPIITNAVSLNKLVLNAGSTLGITSPGTLTTTDTLRVNSTATMNIGPGASVTSSGPTRLDGTNSIVVQSNATTTGSFIDNGTIVGSGKITVQRYASASKWHLISSPISNGLSGIFLTHYLKPFNESTNSWGSYIIPGNIPLTKGKGYAMWPVSNTTFSFNGNPTTGIVSAPVSYTGSASTPGNNLVGNPYPSAIDWNLTPGYSAVNIDMDYFIIWNPNVNNYGMYQRSTGASTNGVSRYIPVGQGFFVKATAASPSFSINNAARVHNFTQSFLKSVNSSVSDIKLTYTGGEGADDVVFVFMNGSSADYDSNEDIEKWFGAETAPQAYSVTGDYKLSINRMPEIASDLVLPVGLETGMDGNYSVSVSDLETMPLSLHYYLEDKKENIFTDLSVNGNYSFFSSTSDASGRFNLHILKNALGTGDMINAGNFSVWSENGRLIVAIPGNDMLPADLKVYDLSGRVLCSEKIISGNRYETGVNAITGIYLVEIVTPKGTAVKKVFIR